MPVNDVFERRPGPAFEPPPRHDASMVYLSGELPRVSRTPQ
jgi:hypothetical protein